MSHDVGVAPASRWPCHNAAGTAALQQLARSCLYSATRTSKEQRRERREIPPPDHPGVHAGRLDVGVVNALGIEPGAELAIRLNQAILGTAGNPEQAELGVGARAELWELGAKFLAKPARAEGAHVGEMVERGQAGVKRLPAAHR